MPISPCHRVVLLLAVFCPFLARSQGYPPGEAASHMRLAPELQAQLVASEPTITQPVCIEFDDRGRLWVMQYIQYPNPAGLKRASVDRWSRTTYDRIPEPPPRGPKGADRITILEDTNHDGVADSSHDFVNELNLASGLAFGHGGVFVLNVPYLLFYPDTNRDDHPDCDPIVCLKGFGMEDAHSVANSLTWGPDGWLYGCQGSTVTAHIRDLEFQQGVWRYHPLTHEFELFCEGGGNAWGLDFDDEGELIYSTNLGPYRNVHGVQGGYYWKSFGKHGALHNPYAFGYYEHVPHTNFTGGHVTDGGIMYQGTNLPNRYVGTYICNDLLGHGVQWQQMFHNGTTFNSAYGGNLLEANDKWFAPTDLTMGPDGALYVADWCDKRTAHPDPDADWDRSNGRVYRIAAQGTKPFSVPDLTLLPTPRIIDLLDSPNDWFRRKARRVLADRRDPAAIAPLTKLVFASSDGKLALEAFWALYVSGGFTDAIAEKALQHSNPAIRKWAIRFEGDERNTSAAIGRQMEAMAAKDSDVRVRLQLACSARRLPPRSALPIVEALLLRDADNSDPYIPLMIWWATEHHSISALPDVEQFFTSAAAWKSKMSRTVIIERLMRRWIAEGTAASYDAAAALLAGAPDGGEKQKLVAALSEGFEDRPTGKTGFGTGGLFSDSEAVSVAGTTRASHAERVTAALQKQIDLLWLTNTTDTSLIRAAAHAGEPRAIERARELVADVHQPTERLRAGIKILSDFGAATDAALVLPLVFSGNPAVESRALHAATALDLSGTIPPVLKQYTASPPSLRADIRETFLSRKQSAKAILDAVEAGQIAAQDFSTEELRVVALHEDEDLNVLVRKHWGQINRGTPEEKLAEMRRLNNDLNAGSGDPTRGHELFQKNCAVCHTLFAEGHKVGPDLTHANRGDREFLMASIIDPSAVIRKEFAAYHLELADGRQLSAVIVEQSGTTVFLGNSTDARIAIPQKDIVSMRESSISLMPEGLLKSMKSQEIRDLFSYLQSNKPLAQR